MSDIIVKKKVGETIAARMDFSAWMGSDATISAIQEVTTIKCDGEDSDITTTSPSIDSQSVTFFVSGGTAGIRYTVNVKITTSEGEILIGEGILVIT